MDKQVIQLGTGKDKIRFKVFDYKTKEPLIGAAIFSFNLKKNLETTDIDGVATTEKELKGNLEIAYVGYYSHCFKLFDNNIDSVLVWLKPPPPPPDIYVVDTTQKVDSSFFYGEKDAQLDLEEGNIHLLTDKGPTEEQNTYAEKHDFKFEIWAGNNYYREAYNEVVIDFLDAWFVGYTPELLAGVWVGFDDTRPLCGRETGARAASPIWVGFMQSLDAGEQANFPVPEGIVVHSVDPANGLLAREASAGLKEYFKSGTQPWEYSTSPPYGR